MYFLVYTIKFKQGSVEDYIMRSLITFISLHILFRRTNQEAGHVACMGKRRGTYRVLMGKP
jgi:hypothetical protein